MVRFELLTEKDLGRTSVLNISKAQGKIVAGTYHGELLIGNKSIDAHSGQLLALYVDGDKILTGGSDGYIRLRSLEGSKLGELEISNDYVYGITKIDSSYAICDGSGKLYFVSPDLNSYKEIDAYEEKRPAREIISIPERRLILVGYYDGLIRVFDYRGKKVRDIYRTTGDSVTLMRLYEPLGMIITGFWSGRISLLYYKGYTIEMKSGRSKKKIQIEPWKPIDLQTIGSVARWAYIHDEHLLALGGNGKLSFQKLDRLLRAALSTRGTRIVARRTETLHDYGANGGFLEENILYSAGLDGYIKERKIINERFLLFDEICLRLISFYKTPL